MGLEDMQEDPNLTKNSNNQEAQEEIEINVDIKQGIQTERQRRKASIQKRRSILIDDNDFQSKVDSFFGKVSNQDEEYLMEYVVGNNGSGGSQDGKDDSADEEEEKEEEENLSPRITALLMQNEDIKISSKLQTSNNSSKSPD